MKHIVYAVIGQALLCSCTTGSKALENPWNNKHSMTIEINSENERKHVAESNEFAFRLLSQTVKPGENIVISPLSAAMAMAMAGNGAGGQTEQQIFNTIGFQDMSQANLFYNKLMKTMPWRDKDVEINIANAIEVNKNYPLNKGFVKSMESIFKARTRNSDFANPATARRINEWCKKQTRKNITSLLDRTEPEAIAYIINAIYFKGAWQHPFKKENTMSKPFFKEKNKIENIQMMSQQEQMPYANMEDYEILRMNYANEHYSMYILLPHEGTTTTQLCTKLTGRSFEKAVHAMNMEEVNLQLPKFESETEVMLNNPLQKLGITDAFSSQKADFSKMSDTPTAISTVLQKAKIQVNEEGAEASAATVVTMMRCSMPSKHSINFHANRPFLYVITENTSGIILFNGIYNGPKER